MRTHLVALVSHDTYQFFSPPNSHDMLAYGAAGCNATSSYSAGDSGSYSAGDSGSSSAGDSGASGGDSGNVEYL
jgi:hypothetical protein